MKKGKIILGVSSLFVTMVGSFAFKAQYKHTKRIFGTISGNGVCQTTNCWKTNSNAQVPSCRTAWRKTVTTLYTFKTQIGTCQNITTHSTLTA